MTTDEFEHESVQDNETISSYLTALMFYTYISGHNPRGLSDAGLDIPRMHVNYMQEIVWEVATASINKTNLGIQALGIKGLNCADR